MSGREVVAMLTPEQASEYTGGMLSAGFIRKACGRAVGDHRLPHIRSGEKRPRIKIIREEFDAWLVEEAARG